MTTEPQDPTPVPHPGTPADDDRQTAVHEPEPARLEPATTPTPAPRARGGERVMRVPTFAPLAPVAGWLTAWGAAALAAACLQASGVDLGFGLGIAQSTQLGVQDGLGAGIVLLIVQGGAFVVGGYVAARIARAAGLTHAVLAWALAMLATGADALVQGVRGQTGVVTRLPGIPYWIDTNLGGNGRLAVALAIFALAALAGAVIGGALGTAVNRAGRREPAAVVEPAR